MTNLREIDDVFVGAGVVVFLLGSSAFHEALARVNDSVVAADGSYSRRQLGHLPLQKHLSMCKRMALPYF